LHNYGVRFAAATGAGAGGGVLDAEPSAAAAAAAAEACLPAALRGACERAEHVKHP